MKILRIQNIKTQNYCMFKHIRNKYQQRSIMTRKISIQNLIALYHSIWMKRLKTLVLKKPT